MNDATTNIARPREAAGGFLRSVGWGDAGIEALAADASFRRYFRLRHGKVCALLMDAPPATEDAGAFRRVAEWLLAAGFAAPRILAADCAQGFLLIEDFGDDVLGPALLRDATIEGQSYGQAVAILARLGQLSPPGWLAHYDRAALLREVLLFTEWFGKAFRVRFDEAGFVVAWDAVWGGVLAETAARPVVTLRDYHVDNLMRLPRPGLQSLGLLDFQDALAGHPAYDLVSLLQDARRDVTPALEEQMLQHYAQCAGVTDLAGFRQSYEVLGAQRNVKILGVFLRLKLRDQRQGYVERLPRVWGYLARNFAHPALAPVRDWFAAHVPADLRRARLPQ